MQGVKLFFAAYERIFVEQEDGYGLLLHKFWHLQFFDKLLHISVKVPMYLQTLRRI